MSLKVRADNFLQGYGRARSVLPWVFPRPLGYFFYITERCNLQCGYCWQRETAAWRIKEGLPAADELSALEWERVIQSIPRMSFVGLSGGEPLLHSGFNHIAQCLANRFRYTINTNAELLDDATIERLIRYRASNISVSLDGFAAVHDVSRNRSGLFDRVVERIWRVNEYKKKYQVNSPALTVKMVLSDEALDSLEMFYRFCNEELHSDCLNISLMKTSPHAQFDFRARESLAEITAHAGPQCHDYRKKEMIPDVLCGLLEKSRKEKCKVLLYPAMNKKPEIERLLQASGKGIYGSCFIPWGLVVLLSNGDIIPCLSFKLANIRDIGYDVKKIAALPAYHQFLRWRNAANRTGAGVPACDMCCFARVRCGKGTG